MPDKLCLFDMDGTLFDYEGQMRSDLSRICSQHEPDPMTMDIWDENGVPAWLKHRMHLIKNVPGWWRDLPKLKIGWVLLREIQKIGFDIQILTKGPKSRPHSWAEKVECVQRHFGQDEVGINIVMDKGGKYGRVLVDDFPEYIERWLECRSRGLVIMPLNRHNKDFKHPNVLSYRHYDDSQDTVLDGTIVKALNAAFNRNPKQHWKDLI